MSHTKPDIIKSFLPIFYLSKIFGCNLYAIPCPLNATNIRTSLTAIDVLFCLVQLALYVFIVLPSLNEEDRYDSVFNNEYAANSGSSGLVIIVFIGQKLSYVVTFTSLLIMIMDMRNAAITRKIFFSFINFDEEVLKLGTKVAINHKTLSRSFVFVFLLWQLPTFLVTLHTLKATNDSTVIFMIATFINRAITMGSIYSYLTTFWYVLVNLADRFEVINECLRKSIKKKLEAYKTGNNKYGSDQVFSEGQTFVCSLSDRHQELVGIVNELSESNAMQLICCIAITFLSSIVCTFMAYQGMSSRIGSEAPVYGAFYSARTMHYSFLLYKAIAIGSKIRKQRSNALSLINKAISLERNKLALMQLNNFHYQIGHSNTTVSCGMFTIDWTLMYTLGAALTSYVFLFMQFNSISNSKN